MTVGFASIIGGKPSSVRNMTEHLLTQTLSQDLARWAQYYGRGMRAGTAEEREIWTLASFVADGAMGYGEALDRLLARHLETTGELDITIEERLGQQLSDAALRLQLAEEGALMAETRPDMHPAVAVGLGLEIGVPVIGQGRINGLLAGRRADGEKIEGKHYAQTRQLPENPKTGERELSQPIGAYDFCPSPDKSVSVAWAFSSAAQRAMIYHAHLEAAREAVGYIAAEIGVARTGKGGEGALVPGHVGWLEFTHYTARRTQITIEGGAAKIVQDGSVPGDPDLHTHFLMPNAVFCDNGRVGSLHTARIGGFLPEADAVYQATLARALREAGFAVELEARTGAAVLTAVPRAVCDLFSKRSKAGELLARQFTAERGETWDELSQEQRSARLKAATQSLDQKVKGGKDDAANPDDWKRQAKAALNWEAPASFLAYGPPAPEIPREQRLQMAYEASLPLLAYHLEQKSVVSHWTVRTMAGRGLVHAGLEAIADIDAVTRRMREQGVEQFGARTALVWGQDEDKRRVSVSTELHESQELEFVALARAAAQDRSAALPIGLLDRTLRDSGLDFTGEHGAAQLAMIRRLGAGGRFSVALAAAGAGKTAALKPLVAAWREQGRRVYGASLAWRQADDLTEAGIAQRDVKAFSVLLEAAKDGALKLDRSSVVAVDEFALLGTMQGLELLRLQAKHGFQVVALGDPKQCAAIQAGNIIALSRRALGAEQIPEVLTTLRQQTAREREIAGLFREGRAKEALAMKRAGGTAEMAPGGYREAIARVAVRYAEILKRTGEAPTVSAPTNADAHAISEAIRGERRALGLLGPDVRRVPAQDQEGRSYEMALAAGDRVRLFKSTGARFLDGKAGNIGRNGSVLEILDVGEDGMTARNLKTGRDARIAWASLAGNNGRVLLAYGDALTINTAQGLTSAEHIQALPAGSQAISGLQAYTAGTRHRRQSWLVTSAMAEQAELRNRRPLNDLRPIEADDQWANVARNFAQQPEKENALAMLERVVKMRRGAVRQFPRSLHAAEQRQQRGEAPSYAPEIKAQRQAEGQLRPILHRLAERLREMRERIAAIRRQATELPEMGRKAAQHPTMRRGGPSMSL